MPEWSPEQAAVRAIVHLPSMTSVAPWWVALGLAALISVGAWRAGSLRPDGALTACGIGSAALLAEWSWGVYLITWFVLASVLSRLGRHRKQQRTAGMIEKADQRDMKQVLANGGIFAICALMMIAVRLGGLDPHLELYLDPHRELHLDPQRHLHAMEIARRSLAVAAAGALAAAGADTWATEVGTWIGGAPWSLRTFRRVAPGTSGAVTLSGTLASAVGALALAMLAAWSSMIPAAAIAAVALGGLGGAIADTVIGAWMQERRWCARCQIDTEQTRHICGTSTAHRSGIRHLGNDTVNALCSIVGGTVALGWWVATT